MAIVVRIGSDGMEAFVDVDRQDGESLDADAILRVLAEAGVVFGIDAEACRDLAAAPAGARATALVARGIPPVDGEDGAIEMAVEFHHSDVGLLLDSGSIDFHERGSFTPVEKGQLLARIVPPTSGTYGRTVVGAEIKSTPGKRSRLTAGKNTRIEADGCELRATLAGDLRLAGDLVEVMDVIRVPGNLDYSVGSIECEGPVRVEGDVLPGFHIRAGGDVWVGGIVENAEIRTRGNIAVLQGVLGGSRIEAGKKVTVGYVRESYVESDGGITINKESVNSTVVAGESIQVPPGGRIVGGRLLARNVIEAGTVDTGHGTPTLLAAGVNPLDELRAARLKKAIHQAGSLEKRIGRMKELAGGPSHDLLDELIERAARKREGSSGELTNLQQAGMSFESCRIQIARAVQQGVRIRIGAGELTVRSDAGKATFYYDPESQQVVQI